MITERKFMQIVSLIAANYGCKVLDVDLDKRLINISGPTKEREIECGDALEAFARQHEDIEEETQGIKQLTDKIAWQL